MEKMYFLAAKGKAISPAKQQLIGKGVT